MSYREIVTVELPGYLANGVKDIFDAVGKYIGNKTPASTAPIHTPTQIVATYDTGDAHTTLIADIRLSDKINTLQLRIVGPDEITTTELKERVEKGLASLVNSS